jgi:alcohol dehydrogenase (cytochrome c)
MLHKTSLAAIRVATGDVAWMTQLDARTTNAATGGALSTDTGLVFIGDDARFYALRSSDGQILWSVTLGDRIKAGAMSYLAGGEQRIAVAAGKTIFSFGLRPEKVVAASGAPDGTKR